MEEQRMEESAREGLLVDGSGAPLAEEDSGSVELSDGTLVAYHAIAPENASALQRFLAAKPDLSDREAAYFTNVDRIDRFALVALDPERAEEIIAVVSFDREGNTERAEYAAEVADSWQGRGLGMALSRRLIEAALKRGVRTLVGIVLPQNRKMLHLFRDLGLPERLRYDYDDGTDYVEIDLTPAQNATDRRAGTSGPQEG